MQENYENTENHPIVQALLDLKRMGFHVDELLNTLTADTEEMQENRRTLRKIWSSHQYPDRKLKFIQSTLFDYCPQRYTVSPEAQALLSLMERLQAPGGYVAVKKGMFATMLGFGSVKERKMQDYLGELKAAELITLISQPRRGSQAPAVYQVNQSVSWVGKAQGRKHLQPKAAIYMRVIEEVAIDDNNLKVRCGTLGEHQEPQEPQEHLLRQKKRRAGAHADATATDSDSKPTDHIDFNLRHDHMSSDADEIDGQLDITDFITSMKED